MASLLHYPRPIPFKDTPRTVNCIHYVRPRALMHLKHVLLTRQSPTFPGDFFIPAFQCPHRVERIGTLGDGGKWVCGMDRIAKQDKCVIYSFGLSSSIGRVLTPSLCVI